MPLVATCKKCKSFDFLFENKHVCVSCHYKAETPEQRLELARSLESRCEFELAELVRSRIKNITEDVYVNNDGPFFT